MSSKELACEICSKNFSCKIDLRAHVRRVHLAPNLICFHCQYTTKFKQALLRHMTSCVRFSPNRYRRRRGTVKCKFLLTCPLCNSFQSRDRCDMIDHYTQRHGVEIVEKQLEFASINEFDEWKKQTEASVCFRFTRYSKRKTQSGCNITYRCFRDGFFKSEGEGRRQMKMMGSVKINGACPCSLKVVADKNGPVRAKYIPCHVGHDFDIRLTNLTKEEKLSIAEKLSQNVPIDVILETIQGSVTEDHCSRIHFTTRKDIRNIKESLWPKNHTERKKKSRRDRSIEALGTSQWQQCVNQEVHPSDDTSSSSVPERIAIDETTSSRLPTNDEPTAIGKSHTAPSHYLVAPAPIRQTPLLIGDIFALKPPDDTGKITRLIKLSDNKASRLPTDDEPTPIGKSHTGPSDHLAAPAPIRHTPFLIGDIFTLKTHEDTGKITRLIKLSADNKSSFMTINPLKTAVNEVGKASFNQDLERNKQLLIEHFTSIVQSVKNMNELDIVRKTVINIPQALRLQESLNRYQKI